MKTYRKTAKVIGSAYLFSNLTFILGTIVMVEAILRTPDYLSLISANRAQVVMGVLLSFANGLAYVGIAVLLFPILRVRFESLALAYVGFRLVEFITQIMADVSPLVLLTLTGDTNQIGAVQGLGALLLAERFWAFQMLNLIFSLSALLLYAMFLHTRLIPEFISIWGLLAAALVLSNTMIGWFNPELGEALGMITGLPMLLNEVFLGLWLIGRGFNQSATAVEPVRQLALEV
ncbi:MAG: DUF4386 domain-containing protein [Anaerolineales bacterium]|nr:DUF4386 domain-containing protein [Anaerolineales bacterium]